MKLLTTDFYRLSMVFVYIIEDMTNTRVGFEGFVRNINPQVTTKSHYIFEGGAQAHALMDEIKKELKDINTLEKSGEGLITISRYNKEKHGKISLNLASFLDEKNKD